MVDKSTIDEIHRRMERAESKVDFLDQHGSRAVGALSLQVAELIKDVSDMRNEVKSDVIQIRSELQKFGETNKRSVRSWIGIGLALLSVLLPLYVLVITLMVSHL